MWDESVVWGVARCSWDWCSISGLTHKLVTRSEYRSIAVSQLYKGKLPGQTPTGVATSYILMFIVSPGANKFADRCSR